MENVHFACGGRIAKFFAIIISIVLVAILLTQISFEDIIIMFIRINPLYLGAGFIFYLGTQFLRTWRFHLLLNREVSIRNLFPIVCIYAMFVNLLPARTGELSYVYLLKTEFKKTTGEGLATLIMSRILDGIIVAVSFLLFYIFIKEMPLVFDKVIMMTMVLLILLMLVLGMLLFSGNKCLNILKKTASFFNFKKIHLGDYILKRGEETIDSIEKFKADNQGLPLSVILITLAICVTTYTFYFLLTTGINIQLHPLQILFASSFVLCTFMIPLQGIGGFGTTEGGWALGFIAVGLSSEMAISSGFVFHIVNLVFVMIVGIFGYFALRFSHLLPRTGAVV